MDTILKVTAGVLIALILSKTLVKHGSEFSPLLIITVCCIILSTAMAYLKPVIRFIDKLQVLGDLNGSLLNILLRVTGMAVLSEITSLICADMGNAALGKGLQILATVTIIWLSIPIFEELLTLLESILGAI